MRKIVALALVPAIAAFPALGAPGVTTQSVNFRSGPGTNFGSLRTIPSGTSVDIGDCDAAGSWCAVTFSGKSGFVSGQYLQKSDEPEGWPRSYDVGNGRMVLYQPQFSEWTGFKSIEALAAAEFTKAPDAKPIFGVIGFKGATSFDEDKDEVVISDITVTELNFSGLSRDELSSLAVETGKLLPTGPITVPEARVTASLAEQKRMTDVVDLKADAPPIFISTSPALLVQTDGAPAFAPIKDAAGLSFVVNTNWDILRVDNGGALFLRDDSHWLTASAIAGPWSPVKELPALLKELPQGADWDDTRAAMPPQSYPNGATPKIINVDKPSELILFEGDPALADVPGTSLQWASNSESDVFFDKRGKQWYVLLSGRWFRAHGLNGPWTFATPDLPADFRKISQDAPYYSVLSSVPGTSESAEARLKASIPTTARVKAGSVTPTVAYAGDPNFAPVETTELSYATNTNETVIKVGTQYFLLQDGVWFVSDSPAGPWQLAREVPDAIYQIPPSSPVYNATYVRVYETEPDAVWYGYTMGYLYGFLAWGTYVYGTGWAYRPYFYNWPGYAYPIYYPRPATWGLGAYYNPIRGAYGRYGYAYGPYRGIAGARTWNVATGTYARAGAAWGPRGTAGFVAAYNPRTDRAGYVAGGRNVYGAWTSAGVTRGSEWARATARTNAAGGSALRWNTSSGQGFVREGRRGDLYAGRDGNVYRNTGNGWQSFDGGWKNVARPERDNLMQRGEGAANLTPEARERIQERGGGDALRGLAGAGAAGAAGAAIGQRLGDGTAPVRPGGGDGAVRDRTRDAAAQVGGASVRRRSNGRPGNSAPRVRRLRMCSCPPISTSTGRRETPETSGRWQPSNSIGRHRRKSRARPSARPPITSRPAATSAAAAGVLEAAEAAAGALAAAEAAGAAAAGSLGDRTGLRTPI